jgi:hypothetical protein
MLEICPDDSDADPAREPTDLVLACLLTYDDIARALTEPKQPLVLHPTVELGPDAQLRPREVELPDECAGFIPDLPLELGGRSPSSQNP